MFTRQICAASVSINNSDSSDERSRILLLVGRVSRKTIRHIRSQKRADFKLKQNRITQLKPRIKYAFSQALDLICNTKLTHLSTMSQSLPIQCRYHNSKHQKVQGPSTLKKDSFHLPCRLPLNHPSSGSRTHGILHH